jgi:hypothetical protein
LIALPAGIAMLAPIQPPARAQGRSGLPLLGNSPFARRILKTTRKAVKPKTNQTESNNHSKIMMNTKSLLSCLTAMLLATSIAFADTIAKWTFETNQPAGSPGAGVWITNIAAEIGTGTAAGWHAGNATYSSVTGNGSAKAFSSQVWGAGDFYQFAVSAIGFQNLSLTFDITRSATGPGTFALQYKTDGATYTPFGANFLILTNGTGFPSWNTTTPYGDYAISFDLSSATALNNAQVVYFRLVDVTDPTSSSGTLRVDNFLVSGTPAVLSTLLNIQRSGNNVMLTWSDSAFALQAAPNATGTYTNVPGAASPHTESIGDQQKFYRLVR